MMSRDQSLEEMYGDLCEVVGRKPRGDRPRSSLSLFIENKVSGVRVISESVEWMEDGGGYLLLPQGHVLQVEEKSWDMSSFERVFVDLWCEERGLFVGLQEACVVAVEAEAEILFM
jgi:hypothetical protein